MVTLQAPVPVHEPDQPVKAEPGAGVAVRFTTWPFATLLTQVFGDAQFTGSGVVGAVMVPPAAPVAFPLTVRGQVAGGKVAVMDRDAVRVAVQVLPATEVH